MEKTADKQVGSSSSFTADLFGPRDSSKSPTSSAGFFGSIFGSPTPIVAGRDNPPPDFANGYGNTKHGTITDYKSEKGNPMKKEKNSSYDNGRSAEPCYYNSSIYYGGQEVYSPTTRTSPPNNFKKKGGNVDQNESNSSNCASRGNWWQGSLYY